MAVKQLCGFHFRRNVAYKFTRNKLPPPDLQCLGVSLSQAKFKTEKTAELKETLQVTAYLRV